MKIFSHEQAYDPVKYSKEFIEKHSADPFPEGFRERLTGKTIEEQMKMFAFVENVPFRKEYYEVKGNEHLYKNIIPFEKCNRVRGLIVDDGVIEGVIIQDYSNQRPAAPYDAVTTFIGDNNNDCCCAYREDIITMICLPRELTGI